MDRLGKAIEDAREFVLEYRDEDGLYRDFSTRSHGIGVHYPTGCIGRCLLKSGVKRVALEPTARAMARTQRNNGGWGFNENAASDSDTTAFAVLLLKPFGYAEEIERARAHIRSHQKEDGSFSTYDESEVSELYGLPPEVSVAGWTGGYPDATASCFLAIGKNKRAVEFLKKSQRDNGSWPSYWWNDDTFGTFLVAEALRGKGCDREIGKSRAWLAEHSKGLEHPFYLALSLTALSGVGEYKAQADRIAAYLLDTQESDGSWQPKPTMRFPVSDNENPWEDTRRKRLDFTDERWIFTTAACLRALYEYREATA